MARFKRATGAAKNTPVRKAAPVKFYVPVTETHDLGPCMKALQPMQRAWVYALLDNGGKDHTRAARLAGYGGANPESAKAQGWRLAHDPKVLAAIKEVAEQRISSYALLGAEALVQIVKDPYHKDHFKAAVELMNRSGMLVAQRIDVQHNHTYDDKATIERVRALAGELGLDAKKLLGSAGVVIDAEFEPVAEPTAEGLEDLL